MKFVRRDGSFLRSGAVVCTALALASLPALAGSANHGKHGPGGGALGAVDFQVSCAPAVRGDFDRAVSLLHHMMYVEAKRAFEVIAERDPACGMAHWGIAMTLFQPLWPTRPSAEDLKRGWDETQQAKAMKPASDRERALVAALEAFFREPESADWWTRIGRWSEAMGKAYEARPADGETAAFYALSQLAAGQSAGDRAAYNARAAKVLLDIYAKEPTHPGAVHYTIHANDIDGRASESLEVVRSYGEIAPSVPHALHMPTHIFVRLGKWPEVIEWNRKSADAALKFPAGDAVSHHYPHATDYLIYAYLQRGEGEKARAVLVEALAKPKYQQSFTSAFHLAAMPARYAVERRDWKEAASLEPGRPASLPWDEYPWAESLTWFARGLGAAHTGDLPRAREAEGKMQTLEDRAKSAGERDFARYIEIDRLILAGRIAQADGKAEEAVKRLRTSAELESTVEKHPVTPGALLPPNEALGDLLLELDRPKEALEAYEASREMWPQRYRTILGAARAAEKSGDGKKARAYYSALLEVAVPSADRAGVVEAKKFLGRG